MVVATAGTIACTNSQLPCTAFAWHHSTLKLKLFMTDVAPASAAPTNFGGFGESLGVLPV